MDASMQQFMAGEQQKQRFQQLVHTLTDDCWDTCIGNTLWVCESLSVTVTQTQSMTSQNQVIDNLFHSTCV